MLELTQLLVPIPDIPNTIGNGLNCMIYMRNIRSREREAYGFGYRPEAIPNEGSEKAAQAVLKMSLPGLSARAHAGGRARARWRLAGGGRFPPERLYEARGGRMGCSRTSLGGRGGITG